MHSGWRALATDDWRTACMIRCGRAPLAIKQNQTTVVMVAVDTLGLFEEETREVEKQLRKELGIDLLTISATHVHEAADLVGAWGAGFGQYGVNEDYRAKVRKAIADAVTDAVQSVQPARVTLGSIAVQDANRDMKHYVSDARDPVVIDNTLHTMQFVDPTSTPPKPIATVVNWAFHPESVGDKNHLISSDFVHVVREDLEKQGAGTVLYISGALGGQIGPGRVEAIDGAGNVIKQSGFPKAEAIGHSVSRFALTAMADPKAVTIDGKTAKLGFRTATLAAQIANRAYHLAFMFKIYRRSLCCYDTTRAIDDDNLPSVQTQMAYLTLGPASIVTNPGELLPELFIGGYGGEYAGTYTFIDMTKPNSADVSRAPKPPYLVDIMDGQRPHRMTFGLTMDFLGYIVAALQLGAGCQAALYRRSYGRSLRRDQLDRSTGRAADCGHHAAAHSRRSSQRGSLSSGALAAVTTCACSFPKITGFVKGRDALAVARSARGFCCGHRCRVGAVSAARHRLCRSQLGGDRSGAVFVCARDAAVATQAGPGSVRPAAKSGRSEPASVCDQRCGCVSAVFGELLFLHAPRVSAPAAGVDVVSAAHQSNAALAATAAAGGALAAAGRGAARGVLFSRLPADALERAPDLSGGVAAYWRAVCAWSLSGDL